MVRLFVILVVRLFMILVSHRVRVIVRIRVIERFMHGMLMVMDRLNIVLVIESVIQTAMSRVVS